MPRIDRKGPQAPAHVLDGLELIPVNKIGPDILAVGQYETIWCLSRIRGIPQAISFGEVTDDAEMSLRDLWDILRAGRTVSDGMRQGGVAADSQYGRDCCDRHMRPAGGGRARRSPARGFRLPPKL
jgi:hypothetical protein